MLFIIVIFSYLFGSIPFAYLLVKHYAKQDIRELGSGNVGAMNTYEITGKKWLGIAVFFLDMLKGLIVVLVTFWLTKNDFLSIAVSGIIVVVGHNYSIFLKFKGGRGLATAVGSFLLTTPIAILFWGLFWLFGKSILKKDIIIANTIAITGAPLLFYFLPDRFVLMSTILNISDTFYLKFAVIILCLVLLIAHLKPLIQLLNKKDYT